MGRKSNYSPDQLMKIVDEYISWKNDYSGITASGLARYCQEQLHLIPAVTYQTFTRCRPVMDYIDQYNGRLHELILAGKKDSDPTIVNDALFDLSALTGSDNEHLLAALEKANERIFALSDLANASSIQAQRLQKEVHDLRQENEALLDTVAKIKEISAQQKRELASARKELREARSKIQALVEFFDKYLYAPVVNEHMDVIGWYDGRPKVKDRYKAERNPHCIGTEAADLDLIKEINSFYEKIHLTDTAVQATEKVSEPDASEENVLPAKPYSASGMALLAAINDL